MTANIINKSAFSPGMAPNMVDYAQMCAGFSWETAAQSLTGLPDGRGINIAHEAVDRHAQGPRAQ